MLGVWRERTIYEARMLDGWEAVLKTDKHAFYAFHLRDPNFCPTSAQRKLTDKMNKIVLPELKTYYKRLLDNQDKLTIECKLSGVP